MHTRMQLNSHQKTDISSHHLLRLVVQLSTLLTVVGAQIHGSITVQRLAVFKNKHKEGFILQSRQGKKARKRGGKGMAKLENVRHSCMSHGTWAVSAWLTASPGHLRSAHVTLFMNGAVWRRDDAAQRGRKRRGVRMQRRWSLLRWLRGGAKRDKEEGGFQRRSSQEQQVRLLWRICK